MSSKIREKRGDFCTPEWFAHDQQRHMDPHRGRLMIAGCVSSGDLAEKVVQTYQDLLSRNGSREKVHSMLRIDSQFSDTETHVRLENHVNGSDVFLFQSLYDPGSGMAVNEKYMRFLIATRTFKESGARHITGVLPYLAYARQDKPTKFKREPTTARLMADMALEAGIDRLITWDPHCGQIRGYYGKVQFNGLESLSLFLDIFKDFQDREDVIVVAPDEGASKFVTHFGRAMNLKCAIASKFRPKPEVAEISEVIGDFSGKKTAVILDDMISTGGTIEALVRYLVDQLKICEIYLGASHNLCTERFRMILTKLHENSCLRKVYVTNSIPQTPAFTGLPFVETRCLSDTLCRVINRIHYSRSVSEVFYKP
ncbi:ribose-phosphate pyrophosphokinase [bacterium]|nr:ribose-phosphate pyrophosphokinase [bacterium]